jgi:hypothetical protein
MAKKNLYTVGGAVQVNDGVYILRKADTELLDYCLNGEFVYVLCPRQVGKSSLMYKTADQLEKRNIRSVIIDLASIGGGRKIDEGRWYHDIFSEIIDALNLSVNLDKWLENNKSSNATYRLSRFLNDVVFGEIEEQIVIFFDEIDTTLRIKFADDFFIAIRSMYNARVTKPEFRRLSFVLIGTATPTDFIKDPNRTPFNIGQRVDLSDFTFSEAIPLAAGLAKNKDRAREILEWVYDWTGGHPYLTQKICSTLSQPPNTSTLTTMDVVAATVKEAFFGVQDFNLQFVRDMLLKRSKDSRGVMKLYQHVLNEEDVPDSEQSINKSHLKLSGIVRVVNSYYKVSNKIYKEVFNPDWVARNMPQSKIYVFLATQIAFILLLALGYLAFFQQPLYILIAIWFIVSLVWTKRLREVYFRLSALLSKPRIYYKDPEPESIPFYPREFLEDTATNFRTALTFPLKHIIESFVEVPRNLLKIVDDKEHPFRLIGYVFFIVSLFMLLTVNGVFISDTISGLSPFFPSSTQKTFLSFNSVALGGTLVVLIIGVVVAFETRSNYSQLSAWSDKDRSTQILARRISSSLIPLSMLALAGWILFNLLEVHRIDVSNDLIQSLINGIYYALIPIISATAAFIIFSDAIRGAIILLIGVEWFVIGFLYLIDRVITLLGVMGPLVLDVLYRLTYIVLDMLQWFAVTPTRLTFLPFKLIQERLLVSSDDEKVKNNKSSN